jgi:signal transduction histidine kinase
LKQTVIDVLELLRPQLTANNVEVRLSLGQQPASVMLDESSLRGALMNLMLNAIAVMPEGGTLSLTLTHLNEVLRLEITDTGPGIAEEEVTKVFEPFYTTKENGLGLGMPYARKIIEQHGGTISLNSRLGEGTTIHIDLPAALKEGVDAS